MKGIGVILKKEREDKKITLEQVEEATKIRRKYLEAIEREEFSLLPGEVYVKGFIATYLKYLGIKDRADVVEVMKPKAPPVDISEQIAAAEQAHAEQSAQNLQRSGKRTSKKKEVYEEQPLTKNTKMILLISIVAILVLFALQGVYSSWSVNNVDDEPQNVVEEQQTDNDTATGNGDNIGAPTEPDVPEPPVYTSLNMTLEVLDVTPGKVDKCWMGITVDGKATDVSLSEGQVQEVYAQQQIDLHLGNAGVVKVTVNGQDLGTLGAQGKVVKQSFKLSDYATVNQQ